MQYKMGDDGFVAQHRSDSRQWLTKMQSHPNTSVWSSVNNSTFAPPDKFTVKTKLTEEALQKLHQPMKVEKYSSEYDSSFNDEEFTFSSAHLKDTKTTLLVTGKSGAKSLAEKAERFVFVSTKLCALEHTYIFKNKEKEPDDMVMSWCGNEFPGREKTLRRRRRVRQDFGRRSLTRIRERFVGRSTLSEDRGVKVRVAAGIPRSESENIATCGAAPHGGPRRLYLIKSLFQY
uniref:Uncharacterized protein n=1 Tax=Timema shepardi TaxID=629360 RepID=A0A7R9AUK7_TIMSH|nr:unnamed protein product [Timema shepardi]